MANSARVEAQAKINLFLRILSREETGYHQLDTLFQRIALGDTVTVSTGVSGRTLDVEGADAEKMGPVEKNLAWRAALAFADAAGGPANFKIEIVKRIPVGGGLGGGSADAAAVLRALNALAEKPLDEKTLAGIAFALGSDVPYLLSTHALAFGSGRGEKLFALGALPAHDLLLAIPPFGVSAADAYGWFDAQKSAHVSGTRATLPLGKKLEWRAIAALAANDLEAVVGAHHSEIGLLRDALKARGAMLAQMSGSGSTVYGVFETGKISGAATAIERIGARAVQTSTVEQVSAVELT